MSETSAAEGMTTPSSDSSYQRIGDPALLDKIDRLFACNVGELVNLPHLVVVGDQSSGKSSVLEGLTRLPFPRDSGLCTRFATQIVFRRAAESSINVTIVPGSTPSKKYRERVRAWSKKDLKHLDAPTFAGIMKEVHEVMGLSTSSDNAFGANKIFSDDVLCLEIHGPQEAHLSIIDVPGIFRTTTPGVTTKEDKTMVMNMVEKYMKNERTVMLAVVPANVDPATQEILEMAKDVDPSGSRTIGVMTKPDLVDAGAEYKVVNLIKGNDPHIKLGWSVVRNPGQKELDSTNVDRGAIEDRFFHTTSPWNTLPREKRGIDALRTRLETVLTQHIQREFPKVKAEINRKLKAAKRVLDTLGPARDTSEKKTKYLLNLSMEFQRIASLAIKADYGGEEIFDTENDVGLLRLATSLVNRNELFAIDMAKFGHEYQFRESETKDLVTPEFLKTRSSFGRNGSPSTRTISNASELDDVLAADENLTISPKQDILKWFKEKCRASRGFELGTFDSSLLPMAMRKQSSNWRALSCGYASDAIALIHAFAVNLLELICGDEHVRERLLNQLMEGLMEKYRKGLAHVNFLLEVELHGVPMTQNHYFNENLKKRRQERIKDGLASQAIEGVNGTTYVQLSQAAQYHPMSNAEYAVHDIHDILLAYYKVARKRFVDNCCMHAVSYHLIHGPDTPLKLFSPRFVTDLTQEQLKDIAGENPAVQRRRTQLKREIQNLEIGRKVMMM